MTVALIEDDEDVLDSLRMLLESRSISVRCFKNAEELLPILDEARPDCIVSNVRMHGLSGPELQRELKSRDAALPLILITGHGDALSARIFSWPSRDSSPPCAG